MKSIFKNAKVQVLGFWLIALVVSILVSNCCGKDHKTFTSISSIYFNDHGFYKGLDSIRADSFVLYYSSKLSQVASISPFTFSLFNSVYATSCISSNLGYKERIVSWKIYCNNDFDQSHLRNTDISTYFYEWSHDASDSVTKFTPLPDIDLKVSTKYLYGEEGIIGSSEGFWGLNLLHRPSKTDTFSFRTEIGLSDGRTIVFNTPTYKLY